MPSCGQTKTPPARSMEEEIVCNRLKDLSGGIGGAIFCLPRSSFSIPPEVFLSGSRVDKRKENRPEVLEVFSPVGHKFVPSLGDSPSFLLHGYSSGSRFTRNRERKTVHGRPIRNLFTGRQ